MIPVSIKIGWRFLIPLTGNWFAAINAIISIVGIAAGILVLNLVWAVMLGFQEDLKEKMLGANAHIEVTASQDMSEYRELIEKIEQQQHVIGAGGFLQRELMIASTHHYTKAVVKGIQPEKTEKVSQLISHYIRTPNAMKYFTSPELLGTVSRRYNAFSWKNQGLPKIQPEKNEPHPKIVDEIQDPIKTGLDPEEPENRGPERDIPDFSRIAASKSKPVGAVFIGKEMAKTLNFIIDDNDTLESAIGRTVYLISPLGDLGPNGLIPRSRPFRIAGVFQSGLFEYDSSNVYMPLRAAQSFFDTEDVVNAIEVSITDPARAPQVATRLSASLGGKYTANPWQVKNKNLLSALKLEQFALGFALLLITVVAAFNIIMTLNMIVMDKKRQIAVLSTIGLNRFGVAKIFLSIGVITGAIGVSLGLTTAYALCKYIQTAKIALYTNVFYFDAIPIVVDIERFLLIGFCSLIICIGAAAYPAWLASDLVPTEGLRGA